MTAASKPRLFIGSSQEGKAVARALQMELSDHIEIDRWDQGVFTPSGYTLDALIDMARAVDFAVLVATPDDTTESRGETQASARDNIVLEFGLFAGALGRERTFLLATGNLKLPTDVLGLTRLPYRAQTNLRAAVTEAAAQVEERVSSLRPRLRGDDGGGGQQTSSLDREVALVCENAVTQGWTVKTNSATTLRLVSPGGTAHTLSKRQPEATRTDLRAFVARLRAGGLRVNSAVRRPVEESPYI